MNSDTGTGRGTFETGTCCLACSHTALSTSRENRTQSQDLSGNCDVECSKISRSCAQPVAHSRSINSKAKALMTHVTHTYRTIHTYTHIPNIHTYIHTYIKSPGASWAQTPEQGPRKPDQRTAKPARPWDAVRKLAEFKSLRGRSSQIERSNSDEASDCSDDDDDIRRRGGEGGSGAEHDDHDHGEDDHDDGDVVDDDCGESDDVDARDEDEEI